MLLLSHHVVREFRVRVQGPGNSQARAIKSDATPLLQSTKKLFVWACISIKTFGTKNSKMYLTTLSGAYFVGLKIIQYNRVAYIYGLIIDSISIPAEDIGSSQSERDLRNLAATQFPENCVAIIIIEF